MLLLLIRHAQAGQRDEAQWPDDRERPITDEGRKIHRRVAKGMRRLGLVPELLLTSPWARALETAEITQEGLRLQDGPVRTEALAASPDLARLLEDIGPRAPDATVALVGHSPFIDELASLLVAGTPTRLSLDFPKSGVAGIALAELAPGAGELYFFLRPKQLMAVGKKGGKQKGK
jgi:phosphohistidine phosphatase